MRKGKEWSRATEPRDQTDQRHLFLQNKDPIIYSFKYNFGLCCDSCGSVWH